MKVRYHEAADREFDEAIDFYEFRNAGLGTRFFQQVTAAVTLIAESPERWRTIDEDVRQCLVSGFPYQILYVIEPGGIFILAVMHGKRDPKYWRSRRA
jgi:plasmid stabilization system protein ParE